MTPARDLPDRRGRQRAKTDTVPALTDQLRTGAPPRPLRLDLVASAAEIPSPTTSPTIDTYATPSAPIAIPNPRPKHDSDRVITPLSARGDGPHFMQLARSLKPKYYMTSSPDNSRHVNHISDSSDSSAGSTKRVHQDMPTSPLSPSMPLSQRFLCGQDPSPHASALRLPPLPRFHPANYEPPSASNKNTTHRSSRPTIHGRQYSDAQQKLHKYQRDIVTNATKAARLNLSPKAAPSPRSPRLNPIIGSPGPMTPLVLESEGDYLMARDTGSPSSKKSNGRDTVERLVQRENERRAHPQRSESLSPGYVHSES